jgi:2-keto-4-pentenoate hydratase/2-oxohepta-3-ene-1,7-dioic acid hydratase in catechol pathway
VKIVRFAGATGPRLGILESDGVVDLVAAAFSLNLPWLVPAFSDLRAFLAGGAALRETTREIAAAAAVAPVPHRDVKTLAPFEAASKILAHVVNYTEHGKEGNIQPPERPFFFMKPASSVTHPEAPIFVPAITDKLDHEVELAVVIGRAGRDIPATQAYDYVGGYTVLNDVSCRDLQRNAGAEGLSKRYGQNWTQGKGLDTCCPIGPCVVLGDELPEPYPLDITCRVNGEIRQNASTDVMIFRVPALLADISRSLTLYPGDIVSTGSPAGGGVGTGKFLKAGDVVECEIERIGVLRNPIVERNAARPRGESSIPAASARQSRSLAQP